MTRARARAMQQKVNSLLSTLDLGTYLDGMLFTSDTLCVIRHIPQEPPPGIQDETQPRQEEEEETPQPRQEEEEETPTPGPVLPDANPGTTTPDEPAPGRIPEGRASDQRQPGIAVHA